jgi:hypothetical protein
LAEARPRRLTTPAKPAAERRSYTTPWGTIPKREQRMEIRSALASRRDSADHRKLYSCAISHGAAASPKSGL